MASAAQAAIVTASVLSRIRIARIMRPDRSVRGSEYRPSARQPGSRAGAADLRAVGSGAREATAQCFEERNRENYGEYGERDMRRVHEREARGCEQCDGNEQAEDAGCVVAQDGQRVVKV